jgi:hypothetical protein
MTKETCFPPTGGKQLTPLMSAACSPSSFVSAVATSTLAAVTVAARATHEAEKARRTDAKS